MKEKYYLVKVQQLFYDPHGSPDKGQLIKFVTTDDIYLEKIDDLFWDSDLEDKLKKNQIKDLAAEDGYNLDVYECVSVKRITKEQYNNYKEILENYERL